MFLNYSIADLFANIYKKRVLNLVALIVLFLGLAVPYSYRTLTARSVVRDTSNYSSYLSYKITAPVEEAQFFNRNTVGGYGDFYGRLIQSNLNGAYLFNDQSEEDLKEIASELGTTEVTLKNSNFDFWNKKIEVNSLVNNAGISVKILTPSKLANDIIEQKLDHLIDKYKQTYSGVTIEKLETVHSKELEKTDRESGVSKVTLLLRLFILGVASVVILVLANVLLYIFNPTMNRSGDYQKYGIHFVTKLDTVPNLASLLEYKHTEGTLVLLGSNQKVLSRFKEEYGQILSENIQIANPNQIKELLAADQVLLIEEYGTTRYKQFEDLLQTLNNLDKMVLGVATYPL